MNTIVDQTGAQIARRVRLEREARSWSQADLARASGVAKASISKIEREEMSPTAVLLVKLAGAFDLTLAGLLLRAEEGAGRLSRAADQLLWRDPASGYTRRQVFMRPEHPLEVVQIELPAGQQVTLPASSYAQIRQVVWVQAGELVISEGRVSGGSVSKGGERHELNSGDSLGFGAPSEVTFANETALPCTYLVLLARK